MSPKVFQQRVMLLGPITFAFLQTISDVLVWILAVQEVIRSASNAAGSGCLCLARLYSVERAEHLTQRSRSEIDVGGKGDTSWSSVNISAELCMRRHLPRAGDRTAWLEAYTREGGGNANEYLIYIIVVFNDCSYRLFMWLPWFMALLRRTGINYSADCTVDRHLLPISPPYHRTHIYDSSSFPTCYESTRAPIEEPQSGLYSL
ncbi:hypothetical protein BDZ89DRAFT_334571 [Hymenopellis radicata]|nr:hypothetical protein BDZ89DRAFT_334571 [Hymenopellis radicata]